MMCPHAPSQVGPALLQDAGSVWTLGSCMPVMSGVGGGEAPYGKD